MLSWYAYIVVQKLVSSTPDPRDELIIFGDVDNVALVRLYLQLPRWLTYSKACLSKTISTYSHFLGISCL